MSRNISNARTYSASSTHPRARQEPASSTKTDAQADLPVNLDAERAVLGAILLDSPGANIAFKKLEPEDFLLPQHGCSFKRMVSMASAGKAIDLLTLFEELHRYGEVEASGGAAYVAQLVDGVPRVSNVEHYARIVKEKALLRNFAYLGDSITRAALDPEADPDEIQKRVEMLSAQYKKEVRAERKLPFRTGAEIAAETPPQVDWLAPPWVAAGSMTEVDGKVKVAGKTTFVTHMVGAVLDGRPFLGEPTTRTPVVYLTEQRPASFRQAMERAGLLGREDFIVLYWKEILGVSWPDVVRDAVAECKRRGASFLVVDTLGQFAGLEGDAENNSGDALAAMRPLQQAPEGIGVVVVRHERKAGGEVGDSGRGSSAYPGGVDTVLSIRRPEGNTRPTLRIIKGRSRFDEVPDELVVELTAQGYVALGSSTDIAAKEAEQAILALVPESEAEAAALDELLEGTGVKRATAQRVIEKLRTAGRIARSGTGRRGDRFRYWIPENTSAQTSIPNGQKETKLTSEALTGASEEDSG